MKFFGISDPSEFFRRVLRCSGEVHTVEADGSERDLKSLAAVMVRSGLAGQMKGIPEINLRIQKPSDMDILFTYAREMGRQSA